MEKPILFNTEMVKAILEGRKTCTRRISKNVIAFDEEKELFNLYKGGEWIGATSRHTLIKDYAPYKVGDNLYVRETWAIQSMSNYDKRIKFMYRATDDNDLETKFVTNNRYEELLKYESKNGWQPSLFMPKEAARVFLKVTDVRIERLQDITEEEARKEGCIDFHDKIGDGKFEDVLEFDLTARDAFIELWDSTVNKKDIDKYGWEANPYVWVIEFERVGRKLV